MLPTFLVTVLHPCPPECEQNKHIMNSIVRKSKHCNLGSILKTIFNFSIAVQHNHDIGVEATYHSGSLNLTLKLCNSFSSSVRVQLNPMQFYISYKGCQLVTHTLAWGNLLVWSDSNVHYRCVVREGRHTHLYISLGSPAPLPRTLKSRRRSFS